MKNLKQTSAKAFLNVRVAMRDGAELATHIYLPMEDKAFPVLLARTPYDAISKGGDSLEWIRQGFVYIRQDVRGRFLSDGEWYPFFNEGNDAEDTLNWIVSQPWCNGNIAMYGGSYVASTQTAAALTGHPALKCITPSLMGALLYHKFYNAGCMRLAWQTQWTLAPQLITDQEQIRNHLPLQDMDTFSSGKEVRFWQDMLAHPQDDTFWKPVSIVEHAKTVQAPAFIRTGWFDLFVHDVFDYFNALRKNGGNEKVQRLTRILVGPWPHNINQRVVGEVDFGEQAIVRDMVKQEVDFIRRLTTESSNEEEQTTAPVRLFVMGRNTWRDAYEWPLADTVWTDLFLASNGAANTATGDGQLTIQPKDAAGGKEDHFIYDPANPVPTHGGAWMFDNIGSRDQSAIEERPDVLVYTSEPLGKDVEVIGSIEVKLFASSSAKDTDFTAKLVDVQCDGKPMSVTDGIVWARYRHGESGREKLLVPGEVNAYTIQCNPTAYIFKKGHRIRLEISGSNFPAFARNLNTGGDMATGTEMLIAHQTIFHSADYPSRVVLPLIESELTWITTM